MLSTPMNGGAMQTANPALNLAPFSRWTLRDKAAQRRLALRSSGHRSLRSRLTPLRGAAQLEHVRL